MRADDFVNARLAFGYVENSKHEALRRLVVERWAEVDRPPVNARLLEAIQTQIEKNLRLEAGVSPATIARILADAGAELRHPEIIESDAAWRQGRLDNSEKEFAQIRELTSAPLTDLRAAEDFIRNLETKRQKFEHRQERDELAQLKSLAIEARQAAQSISRNAEDGNIRLLQSEIAEWIKVWLQTPKLFDDWLELRRRSEEFRAKFSNDHA